MTCVHKLSTQVGALWWVSYVSVRLCGTVGGGVIACAGDIYLNTMVWLGRWKLCFCAGCIGVTWGIMRCWNVWVEVGSELKCVICPQFRELNECLQFSFGFQPRLVKGIGKWDYLLTLCGTLVGWPKGFALGIWATVLILKEKTDGIENGRRKWGRKIFHREFQEKWKLYLVIFMLFSLRLSYFLFICLFSSLILCISLNLHISWVHGILCAQCVYTLYANRVQEMAVDILLLHCPISLHFTKHKFKNKVLRTSRTCQQNIEPNTGISEHGPDATFHVLHPQS